MSQLSVISGKKLVKTLKKCGYYIRDQKGTHIHLRHPTRPLLTIPNHRIIARGTMRAIIRDAELNLEEFLEQLK